MGPSPDWTVLGVLRAAQTWLESRGVATPRRVAELLVCRALGLDRLRLYLAHDRPMDERERGEVRRTMARVGSGEPVAYVFGDQAFRDLVLEVNPSVLIPRPETEVLVDFALERLPPGGRFLDLGTGSGAIALALATERPDARGVAVDISPAALEVAGRNREQAGVGDRLELRCGSWWQPIGAGEVFDLVVSNPPYVDPQRPELLGPGVAEYEPREALFTPAGDPAAPYRAVAAGLEAGLRPGGWVLLETGVGAATAARRALEELAILGPVALESDGAGHPRYLLSQRPAEVGGPPG